MKKWLKGLVIGLDGQTSISNLVMFVGLGVVFPIAVAALGLVLLGRIEWPAEAFNWFTNYSAIIILPYIMKKLSYALYPLTKTTNIVINDEPGISYDEP